jgi:hypothetical protein
VNRPSTRKSAQINGLRRGTCEAIRLFEAGRASGPGAVAHAIGVYEGFLRKRGRILYLSGHQCPCCDPVYARDLLQQVLWALPPGAGRDLRRLIAKLDADFERRTLPDPWYAGETRDWWHHRLHERD